MYKDIATDYLHGVKNSFRIVHILLLLITDDKFRKVVFKIIKFNFLVHFLPLILIKFIYNIFGLSLFTLLYIINIPLNIFSSLFHFLHYTDLVNIVCVNADRSSNTMPAFDVIALTITLSIYQLIIYLATTFINFLFWDRLWFLAMGLNFLILAMYHSLYCFNNLWQYQKIDVAYRIDMHEKLWPYYLGYGTIATVIYLNTINNYMVGLYNLYIGIILCVPFLIPIKYPRKIVTYFSINLTIFSNLTVGILTISKRIFEFISK